MTRDRAFGQEGRLTWADRLGIWLSKRQILRRAGGLRGKRIADIGCGYHARLALALLEGCESAVLVDVALSPDLKRVGRLRCIEGTLPGALAKIPTRSLDLVICNSVLEHLWEPVKSLRHFHRLLTPGGTALLNVPSWRGKRFLEFSAFRLGLSPAREMDDHKCYYDPRDLWPLLVRAGFPPSGIRCFYHKGGLNTFAVCRKGGSTPRGGRV